MWVNLVRFKGKDSGMKEHVKNWTYATYKVIGIDKSGLNGQVSYKLEGLTKF